MRFVPEIVTLCHAALEHPGQQLSILGAFSSIFVDRLPVHIDVFSLACRLRFEDVEAADADTTGTEHKLKATVVDTDRRVLGQMIVPFNLFPAQRSGAGLTVVFRIKGMDLHCTGEHIIDLVLDDQEPTRFPFQVVLVDASQR
jgi:hypothetical protein